MDVSQTQDQAEAEAQAQAQALEQNPAELISFIKYANKLANEAKHMQKVNESKHMQKINEAKHMQKVNAANARRDNEVSFL